MERLRVSSPHQAEGGEVFGKRALVAAVLAAVSVGTVAASAATTAQPLASPTVLPPASAAARAARSGRAATCTCRTRPPARSSVSIPTPARRRPSQTFGDIVPGRGWPGPAPAGEREGRVLRRQIFVGQHRRGRGQAPRRRRVRRGQSLFALAQGHFTPGQDPGSPADPDTGQLPEVDGRGGFSVVADGLDRPTSLEVIGDTAYVVTLTARSGRSTTSAPSRADRLEANVA